MFDHFSLKEFFLQRWAAALVVLMVILLAFSFNSRLSTIRQLREEEARLKQTATAEKARQAELGLYRDYVASDSYVEHWARVEARMIKPGEVAVVPVAAQSVRLTPAAPTPARLPATVLEEWWLAFFGEATATP